MSLEISPGDDKLLLQPAQVQIVQRYLGGERDQVGCGVQGRVPVSREGLYNVVAWVAVVGVTIAVILMLVTLPFAS